MSTLTVTPEELMSIASTVESEIGGYTQCYQKIQADAQDLCARWKGAASEAFLSRITAFDNDFKSLNNLLLNYVDFLRMAASRYEQNENEIIEHMRQLSTGN